MSRPIDDLRRTLELWQERVTEAESVIAQGQQDHTRATSQVERIKEQLARLEKNALVEKVEVRAGV